MLCHMEFTWSDCSAPDAEAVRPPVHQQDCFAKHSGTLCSWNLWIGIQLVALGLHSHISWKWSPRIHLWGPDQLQDYGTLSDAYGYRTLSAAYGTLAHGGMCRSWAFAHLLFVAIWSCAAARGARHGLTVVMRRRLGLLRWCGKLGQCINSLRSACACSLQPGLMHRCSYKSGTTAATKQA